LIILKKGTLDLRYVEEKISNASFSNLYLYARGRKLTDANTGDNEFYFSTTLNSSQLTEFNTIISESIGKIVPKGFIKELFFPPNDAKQNIGSYSVNSVSKKSSTYFTFHIPNDFSQIESINVFYVPLFNNNNDNLELSSTYGSVGEDYDQNQEAEDISVDFEKDKLSQLDVKTVFGNLSPNSMCGLKIQHDKIGGTVRYVGIEVRYYANL